MDLQHKSVDELIVVQNGFAIEHPEFDLFARVAIPEIVGRKAAANEPKHVKIWCAGCSTGLEAYTLASLATDALDPYPDWTFTVVGSDPSGAALAVARDGVYSKLRIGALPTDVLGRHFDVSRYEVRVTDHVRANVVFLKHDLGRPFPDAHFDAVFCRDLTFALPRFEQARLSHEMASHIRPEGFLFAGGAEHLPTLEADFRIRVEGRGHAYQKRA